jgi:hypothetical protein
MSNDFVPGPHDTPGAQIPYRYTDSLAEAVMRVVHDLESWRSVETSFDNRKLIDDATKKLRAAVVANT